MKPQRNKCGRKLSCGIGPNSILVVVASPTHDLQVAFSGMKPSIGGASGSKPEVVSFRGKNT